MQCSCRRFGLPFQNRAKIVLEKVVKKWKSVKVIDTSPISDKIMGKAAILSLTVNIGGHGDRSMMPLLKNPY